MKRLLRLLRAQVTPWPLVHSHMFLGERWRVAIWWSDVPRLEEVGGLLEIGWARLSHERPEDRLAIYHRGKWRI